MTKEARAKLRSAAWFGTQDKNGFMYRSRMKNQGIPDHEFDGRPIAPEELERRLAALGEAAKASPRSGDDAKLYLDHVLQADDGCDFDFLVGCRGAGVPAHSH